MPDPDFTTVGYPNPESPAAFKLAEELGQKFGAELLMATDPDSDRFAIEIRDDSGKYIPMNGNQTGVLLVNYILEGRKSAGTLPANGAMIARIEGDPAFGLSRAEIEAELSPEQFTGRASQQVGEYLENVIQPLLKAHPQDAGWKPELNV